MELRETSLTTTSKFWNSTRILYIIAQDEWAEFCAVKTNPRRSSFSSKSTSSKSSKSSISSAGSSDDDTTTPKPKCCCPTKIDHVTKNIDKLAIYIEKTSSNQQSEILKQIQAFFECSICKEITLGKK